MHNPVDSERFGERRCRYGSIKNYFALTVHGPFFLARRWFSPARSLDDDLISGVLKSKLSECFRVIFMLTQYAQYY